MTLCHSETRDQHGAVGWIFTHEPSFASCRAAARRHALAVIACVAPRRADKLQPCKDTVLRTIAVCLLALCFSRDARAHDPFEIWTMAVLRAEHLELAITMAQSTALRLIDPQAKTGAITLENFSLHRANLEKAAPTLCVLTAGRKPLVPQKVDVELTDENDIVFRLAFARPPSGRLHFRAACLQKLGQGYGSLLDVSADDGDHLGWEQLSFENPSFEVIVPAPASRKK